MVRLAPPLVFEVHARRMRRDFSELIALCRSSDDDLASMAERFIGDEKATQAQCDAETDHSRAGARQTAWDRDVSQQSLGLSRFVK